MARFAPLVVDSHARLAPHPCERRPWPADKVCAVRDERRGQLRLDSAAWGIPPWGEWRWVCITAPKIDIVTLFFFPEAPWQLPVYAMEFVVFGDRPVVAVIDTPCLGDSAACRHKAADLTHRARRATTLADATDPPPWYAECRSGWDVFTRPTNPADLDQLEVVHHTLWGDLVAWLPEAEGFDANAAAQHQRRLRDYKDHHRDHSPGWKLLMRSFGQTWSQTFLTDYLFA